MKKRLTKNEYITYGTILVIAAFMIFYPYSIKHIIISHYKQGLKEASEKLTPKERDRSEKELRAIEKGQLYEAQEHDTNDFIHLDYFGEPWRIWASTFIVWEKARNMYFIFIALLLLRPYLGRVVDYINIKNLRAKGIEAKIEMK